MPETASSVWTTACTRSGSPQIHTHHANTLLLDNARHHGGVASRSWRRCLSGRRVMAVCGDGGFMMNFGDRTAVRLKLNLVVTIVNDAAYGMIRRKQASTGSPTSG